MKPNPTALILDQDRATRRLLRTLLESEHYRVLEATTAQSGLQAASKRRLDVIIMESDLPDMNGLTVLRCLREWSLTPVLVLAAVTGETEKIAALDNGANDYLTKPFSSGELLARLRVLQRWIPGALDQPILIEGDFTIDATAQRVTYRGRKLKLTATEQALLQLLVRYVGRTVTAKHLLRCVWGLDAEDQRQYLREYVARLRHKLQSAGMNVRIQTEDGLGYRLSVTAPKNEGAPATAFQPGTA